MLSTRDLFNRHRLRCTSQRLALYEALRGCTSHPTAEELYQMVRPRVGRVSRATVYNTLEALCGAGLARRVPCDCRADCDSAGAGGGGASARYDADVSEHLHVRLAGSAEIRDVPAPLGRRLMEALPREVLHEIETMMGVRIETMSINLVGRPVAPPAAALPRP